MRNANYSDYEIERETDSTLIVDNDLAPKFRNHFHRKIELHYILKGRKNMTINNIECSFNKDEIAFIPSFYPHSNVSCAEGTEIIRMIFPCELSADALALLKDKVLPSEMRDTQFNKISIYPLVKSFYDSYNKDKEIVAKGYINALIGSLFYHYKVTERVTDKNLQLLVEVLNYIDAKHHEKLTLESVSAKFGYNKFHFSRMFNKAVSMHLNDYINFVRVQKFRRLYRSSDTPKITKLSYECGFVSLATFYRAFNAVYGCSPKEYFNES